MNAKRKTAATTALDPVIPIKEVSRIACMSMPGIYVAIDRKHLQTFLIGRRRYARESAVRNWIDWLQKQSDAGKPITYRPRVV